MGGVRKKIPPSVILRANSSRTRIFIFSVPLRSFQFSKHSNDKNFNFFSPFNLKLKRLSFVYKPDSMKLFNFYSDEELVDYTWYQSSNIVFSKCIDNPNALKTLIVVFSNGGTYQYSDVPVQKYLEFREASSQGKALNEIIKSKEYPYTKLGNSNLEAINEDYIHRTGRGYYYSNAEKFVLTDYQNKEVYSSSTPLNEESLNVILDVFKAVGIIAKEKKNLL